MSSLTMIDDDIIDCYKNHICITDYNKLKIVCSKYKNCFCLKKLIYNNNYSEIVNIKGCTIEILIYIICKNVLKNIDNDVAKNITGQILVMKNKFSLDNYKNGIHILNYIILLYYHCYCRDIKNIIKLIEKFIYFCEKKINLNNLTQFTIPIISYIDDIQENIITKYSNTNYNIKKYNDIINMLLYINLNLFLIIILKNIKIILPQNYNNQSLEAGLYMIQSEKIKLIKHNIHGHLFPDYYIKYVIMLTNKLYI